MARLGYVLRHVFLVYLLIAVLSANLKEDPVDQVLQPWSGRMLERVGLRQYWAMFAPDPGHGARFVEATSVTRAGREALLGVNLEPPWDQSWYFRLGYNRVLKFHKEVVKDNSTQLKPYAESLCRIHDVHGLLELNLILYYVPSPSRRAGGMGIMRSERPLGAWRCP